MSRKGPTPGITNLYLARSGPAEGDPLSRAAFSTRNEAIQFLVALHGLEKEEASELKKAGVLNLKPAFHGAEICAVEHTAMSEAEARKALTGELYLRDAPVVRTPRRLWKPGVKRR